MCYCSSFTQPGRIDYMLSDFALKALLLIIINNTPPSQEASLQSVVLKSNFDNREQSVRCPQQNSKEKKSKYRSIRQKAHKTF